MNKWCFLLIAACLLAPDTGHAALKARDDVKAEDAFNPNPAPDDLILPMPCGQSMVLKAVGVRGKGLLWDLETRFGRRDGGSDDRGYYDSPYASAISGPFVLKDLPPDWRQKIKAANPDADAMQFYFEGKYEVSKRQWDAVMGGQCMDGDTLPALSPEDARPVVEVSWHEAQEFTRKYTEWLLANAPQSLPGFQGDDRNTAFIRLPTEAEWEYAARGAQKVSPLSLSQEDFFEMPMGDAIKNYAVFRDSEGTSEETLQRIGSRKPNPAGFYDMAGNAAEMVQDGFQFSLGCTAPRAALSARAADSCPRRMRSCPDGGKKWPPSSRTGPTRHGISDSASPFPASTPPAAQGPRNWPRNGRRPGSSCPPN